MAKGTIWGSFTGAPTSDVRPAIEWTSTPNVSGNYSDVTASLVFFKYNSAWGSWNGTGHSVSMSIAGNAASASRTFDLRSSTKVTVWTRTVRGVKHNSDGRKSIVISASGSTGLRLGNYSFSQSVSLDEISRNSTLNSASFNSRLETGKTNSIKYNISRAQSGYVHQFQLRDGATTLDTWHNVTGSGDGSLTVDSGLVNTIMGRMGTVTSKNFTLRMATRDGVDGSWVGSAETLTIKATIGTVSSSGANVSVSISGYGYDNSLGLYVEGRSRVYAHFSPQASGGATIRSSHIVIEKTNGQDRQTINGSSGTSRVLRQSGSYQAQGVAVDSRGVTVKTGWTTFTVSAYSPPAVIHTTAEREVGTNPETTATVRATVRHTRLTGNNRTNEVTVRFYRRESGNSLWGGAVNTQSSSGKSLNYTYGINDANKPIDKSYDYRIVATDNFGNSNESIITLTTQRVVLDIHKNDGVGIGKVHEHGVLDVDGEAYFRGNLVVEPTEVRPSLELHSYDPNGHAYVEYFGNDGNRKGYIGFPTPNNNHLVLANEHPSGSVGDIRFQTNTGRIRVGWDDVVGAGYNDNGDWVRFYDGTQICWYYGLMSLDVYDNFTKIDTRAGSLYRSSNIDWKFPKDFTSDVAIFGMARLWSVWATTNGQSNSEGTFIQWATSSRNTVRMNVMAIGRWK